MDEIAEEAKGIVRWTLIFIEDGCFYSKVVEADMGQTAKSFDEAWKKHLDKYMNGDIVITLRPDQLEDLQDVLTNSLKEEECLN